jgi:hypothetical protein
MQQPYIEAFNVLKIMGVPVFTNADNAKHGNFFIDGEARNSDLWISYHFPFPHWEFGVNPTLGEVLDQFGLMAEWVNPGLVAVLKIQGIEI